jgi:peptide subunit release factor 1 (eRF1)
MKLTKLIKRLGTFEPDGFPFLSLYINAESDQTGRDNFGIWLKKELSEKGREFENDPDFAALYTSAEERITEYVENEVDASTNGIAIFTSLSDEKFFEAMQFSVPFPENQLFSLDRPHIFPLALALDQNPEYAVLWADTNKADIYIFGGENRIQADNVEDPKVENIENVVTGRSKAGGWSQGRFQRRIENFHLQHAKETVAELETLMREKDIDHLVLCGDEATIIPVLRSQMSKELEPKIIATLNLSQYDSVDQIRTETLKSMGIDNAVKDKEQVERLNDAANAAAGLGSLGVEATLRALANGQVEELVISSNIDAIVYQPKRIEKILNEYAAGEDSSSVEAEPEVEIAGALADELILKAINTDAKIIFIEDESLLEDAGGVGAILRYNMNATANG